MKENKTMQAPELEFIRFDNADVITTSGGEDVPPVLTSMTGTAKDETTGYKTFGGFSEIPTR